MNNREREMWIDNDEGLYNWWRSSRLSKREFIKQNREELDACINRELNRPPIQPGESAAEYDRKYRSRPMY